MAVIKDVDNNMHINNNNNSKKRTSKGRQKISIAKIEHKANLQVTFSKRRSGLFNKASELCILCGAEIAILVFSPKGKPHCFAHPNLNAVLNRYLNEEKQEILNNNPCFKELNKEYEEALRELGEEKKSAKEIKEAKKESDDGFWWDLVNVDGLGGEELEEYVNAMEELKRNVKGKMRKLMNDALAAAAAAALTAGRSGGGDYGVANGVPGFGFENHLLV